MFKNFKRMLLALYRLEEGQQAILERLDRMERAGQAPPLQKGCDAWVQSGIDSILSFQVGVKKEGAER